MKAIEEKPIEGKSRTSWWKILRQMMPRWVTRWFPATFVAEEHTDVHRDLQILGRNIQERREAMKLSRKDLAALARLSPKTVERIEHGKSIPCYLTLQKLATALHMGISIRSRT